jgi:hypothetical protein
LIHPQRARLEALALLVCLAMTPSAAVQTPDVPVERLAELYARGEFNAVKTAVWKMDDFRTFARDVERRTPEWPDKPTRRPLFFLELAAAAYDNGSEGAAAAARRLIDSGCALVRRGQPSAHERRWHVAAIGLLHRALDSNGAEEHAAHARSRFLDEPTFVLARAIAQDQRTSPLAPPAEGIAFQEAVARYELAAGFGATAAEARARLGYLLYRLARYQEAWRQISDLDTRVTDRQLLYWVRLFQGRVLEAIDKPAEAGRAYRAALGAWPQAQSATVALLALEARQGRHATASRLAETVGTGTAEAWDPWWDYWAGDYRFFAKVISGLREDPR